MNCNKKSHFDGVTPVHRQAGVGGGFGYVSVCKEEVLAQALQKERGKEEGKWKEEVRKKNRK